MEEVKENDEDLQSKVPGIAKQLFSTVAKSQTQRLFQKMRLQASHKDQRKTSENVFGDDVDFNDTGDFKDCPPMRKTKGKLKLKNPKSETNKKVSENVAEDSDSRDSNASNSFDYRQPNSSDSLSKQQQQQHSNNTDVLSSSGSGTELQCKPRSLSTAESGPESATNSEVKCKTRVHTQCRVCGHKMSYSLYLKHLPECSKKTFGKQKDSNKTSDEAKEPVERVKCEICSKDITYLNTQRQTQHINTCVDKIEAKKQEKVAHQKALESARTAVLGCPMCSKNLKTASSRQNHLKKCAMANKMTVEQVKNLVRQQEEAHHAKLDRGILPEEFMVTKMKNAKPSQMKKMPQNQLEEDMQLALALSNSMVEESDNRQKEESEAFKVLMAAQAHQAAEKTGKGKGRKGKQGDIPTLLMTLSREQAAERISDRVERYIFTSGPPKDIASTPPFKTKKDKPEQASSSSSTSTPVQSLVLWTKTTLKTGTPTSDPAASMSCQPQTTIENFYVEELMPPVTMSTVVPGSKLKRVSAIPGRRRSNEMMVQEEASPVSDSQHTHDDISNTQVSQTVDILTELALENDLSGRTVAASQRPAADLDGATADENQSTNCQFSTRDVSGFCLDSAADQPPNSAESSGLSAAYLSLVNSSAFSDLTILVRDGRQIPAHKLVLHARCPELLVLSRQQEIKDTIDLSQYDKESVLCVLRFVYAGCVSVPDSARNEVGQLAARFSLTELGASLVAMAVMADSVPLSEEGFSSEKYDDRDIVDENNEDNVGDGGDEDETREEAFDDSDWLDVFQTQREKRRLKTKSSLSETDQVNTAGNEDSVFLTPHCPNLDGSRIDVNQNGVNNSDSIKSLSSTNSASNGPDYADNILNSTEAGSRGSESSGIVKALPVNLSLSCANIGSDMNCVLRADINQGRVDKNASSWSQGTEAVNIVHDTTEKLNTVGTKTELSVSRLNLTSIMNASSKVQVAHKDSTYPSWKKSLAENGQSSQGVNSGESLSQASQAHDSSNLEMVSAQLNKLLSDIVKEEEVNSCLNVTVSVDNTAVTKVEKVEGVSPESDADTDTIVEKGGVVTLLPTGSSLNNVTTTTMMDIQCSSGQSDVIKTEESVLAVPMTFINDTVIKDCPDVVKDENKKDGGRDVGTSEISTNVTTTISEILDNTEQSNETKMIQSPLANIAMVSDEMRSEQSLLTTPETASSMEKSDQSSLTPSTSALTKMKRKRKRITQKEFKSILSKPDFNDEDCLAIAIKLESSLTNAEPGFIPSVLHQEEISADELEITEATIAPKVFKRKRRQQINRVPKDKSGPHKVSPKKKISPSAVGGQLKSAPVTLSLLPDSNRQCEPSSGITIVANNTLPVSASASPLLITLMNQGNGVITPDIGIIPTPGLSQLPIISQRTSQPGAPSFPTIEGTPVGKTVSSLTSSAVSLVLTKSNITDAATAAAPSSTQSFTNEQISVSNIASTSSAIKKGKSKAVQNSLPPSTPCVTSVHTSFTHDAISAALGNVQPGQPHASKLLTGQLKNPPLHASSPLLNSAKSSVHSLSSTFNGKSSLSITELSAIGPPKSTSLDISQSMDTSGLSVIPPVKSLTHTPHNYLSVDDTRQDSNNADITGDNLFSDDELFSDEKEKDKSGNKAVAEISSRTINTQCASHTGGDISRDKSSSPDILNKEKLGSTHDKDDKGRSVISNARVLPRSKEISMKERNFKILTDLLVDQFSRPVTRETSSAVINKQNAPPKSYDNTSSSATISTQPSGMGSIDVSKADEQGGKVKSTPSIHSSRPISSVSSSIEVAKKKEASKMTNLHNGESSSVSRTSKEITDRLKTGEEGSSQLPPNSGKHFSKLMNQQNNDTKKSTVKAPNVLNTTKRKSSSQPPPYQQNNGAKKARIASMHGHNPVLTADRTDLLQKENNDVALQKSPGGPSQSTGVGTSKQMSTNNITGVETSLSKSSVCHSATTPTKNSTTETDSTPGQKTPGKTRRGLAKLLFSPSQAKQEDKLSASTSEKSHNTDDKFPSSSDPERSPTFPNTSTQEREVLVIEDSPLDKSRFTPRSRQSHMKIQMPSSKSKKMLEFKDINPQKLKSLYINANMKVKTGNVSDTDTSNKSAIGEASPLFKSAPKPKEKPSDQEQPKSTSSNGATMKTSEFHQQDMGVYTPSRNASALLQGDISTSPHLKSVKVSRNDSAAGGDISSPHFKSMKVQTPLSTPDPLNLPSSGLNTAASQIVASYTSEQLEESSPLSLRQRIGLSNPFGTKTSKEGNPPTANQQYKEIVTTKAPSRSQPPQNPAPSTSQFTAMKVKARSQLETPGDGDTQHATEVVWADGDDDDCLAAVQEFERQDMNSNSKTPKHQTVSVLKKKKAWKAPSPFTPMPPYDDMNTPELKKAVSKIGVRPVGKKRMKELMKQVYHQTHQYETDSDYDGTPVKHMQTNVGPSTSQQQGGHLGKMNCTNKSSAGVTNAKIFPKARKVLGKTTAVTVTHGSSFEMCTTQKAQKDNSAKQTTSAISCSDEAEDDSLPASQDSSYSDGPDLPEESILQGWPDEEEEEDLAASQILTQTSSEALSDKLVQFIMDNKDIHEKILMYEPLELDVLKSRIKDASIRVSLPKVMDFLDERCITFTMKNMSARNNNNRQRRPRPQTKGKSPSKTRTETVTGDKRPDQA